MQPLDSLDAILMDVQASQLGALFQSEQTVAPITLKVEHLELREELHALYLCEAYNKSWLVKLRTFWIK